MVKTPHGYGKKWAKHGYIPLFRKPRSVRCSSQRSTNYEKIVEITVKFEQYRDVSSRDIINKL